MVDGAREPVKYAPTETALPCAMSGFWVKYVLVNMYVEMVWLTGGV